jgi:tRNA modification GTPase
MAHPETIAAIATAPGRAAIGIVRISGSGLHALIEALIGRTLPARRAVLCEFHDAKGMAIDQGFAIYFPAPHSYTGEDVLELHGHGGPVVLRLVLRRCLELGARVAQPGEFTKRAFLNDKIDLAQAEGVIDLIDAATEQAARCAVRSLCGDFSNRIQLVTEDLLELRTLVEANLDFPEEDVDIVVSVDIQARLRGLLQKIEAVLEASRQGSLLREGMDVVLAGQPNVGKSSLLNRLAGEDLAIVTEVPGTTRDVIRQVIDVDGIPVRVLDTAGLRTPTDVVESLGIARTWEAIARADLVVLMIDAQRGETGEDAAILERLPAELPCIRVMNKVDLVPETPRVEQVGEAARVWVSAKTGAGMDLLRRVLLEAAGWKGTSEGLYLARERHLDALGRAQAHLREAETYPQQLEFIAEELRLAQLRLSGITGEITADELLGNIFSRFCIGK